ncbi:flagellar biosynthetic protein FlhB [Oceanicola granulosus HTCC2516]|uniref:Flagellar biosynthetic protein FlhB n=1 Tax=Oceanicola granulosus (strain ATCC BAA-861 / DSM 15982 / KCTC 12143 / HTCC2516) TaxID=314256 RepID=Q2CDI1_OCEGH|nr:flagellar type III secretion system protein FlhB [Oceanicola granulosus]EAR50730.1 flagellar biosynthetic protein FlhB [Oceanicola granulosus HTCC2516]
MSHDDGADKSFEPTQKKLDDARRKGDLPRSADLTTAAAYAGFLLAALALGGGVVDGMGSLLRALVERADALSAEMFAGGAAPRSGAVILAAAGALAPILLGPAAAALVAVIAQRGLVFAPSKLAPKLSRISPLSTAKQKFGRTGLFEFAKSFAKLTIYSITLGLFLSARLPDIVGTIGMAPAIIAGELLRLMLDLLLVVVLIAAAIGALDLLFQRADHLRKNRMSRKEVTDEMKQSEGDPAMKQQRRQKAVAIATTQMMADVPTADVVIVNPTHYAVALKWDRGSPGAPVCVAKGVDAIAARIRELALEHVIPLHSDPPTARALFAETEIGAEIHPDHYRAVAAAIRFAERLQQKARGR